MGRCGIRQHAATKANGDCRGGGMSIYIHILQRSFPPGARCLRAKILSAGREASRAVLSRYGTPDRTETGRWEPLPIWGLVIGAPRCNVVTSVLL